MSKPSTFVVPSSQSDRDKIASAVKEAGDSHIRIQAERDLIKDIAASMKEDFQMPPKDFNKMVKTYVKSSYAADTAAAEEFAEAYQEIMAKADKTIGAL